MSRWLYVTLCLVLFLLAMSGVGWIINATVPPAVDWAVERVGIGPLWAGFVVLWLAGAAFVYRERAGSGTASRARSP